MEKIPNGVECKISKRPCTGFEWRANGVKKQTCVAYAVAAQKNICQVCMNDLTFGLPVGVRDAFLKKAMEKGVEGVNEMFGTLPKSRVGLDYMFNQQIAEKASADAGTLLLEDDSSEAISSLVKGATAHAQDNTGFRFHLPDICPAWVNDSCKLKRSCPRRPCCGLFKFPELPRGQAERLEAELKKSGPENVHLDESLRRSLKGIMQHQNEKQSGKNSSSGAGPNRTLFVANLSADASEDQVRTVFSKFPGLIRVSVLPGKAPEQGKIAFVEYSSPKEAQFVLSLSGLMVGSSSVHLSWARPSSSEPAAANEKARPFRGNEGSSRSDDKPSKRVHHDNESTKPRKLEKQEEAAASRADDADSEKKRLRPGTDQPKTAIPSAPAALQNALKLRKAKGLDDD